MSEFDAEEADKWVKVGEHATDLVAHFVSVLGPWQTAFLIVGLVAVAVAAYLFTSARKAKEEAAAVRGYESSIEVMSSEIRMLRMTLLLNSGRSIEDAARILEITTGHRQLAGQPAPQPAAAAPPAALPAPLAGAAAPSSTKPHRPKTRRGKP